MIYYDGHSGLSKTGNVMALTIQALQKVFNEYDEDIVAVAKLFDYKIIFMSLLRTN